VSVTEAVTVIAVPSGLLAGAPTICTASPLAVAGGASAEVMVTSSRFHELAVYTPALLTLNPNRSCMFAFLNAEMSNCCRCQELSMTGGAPPVCQIACQLVPLNTSTRLAMYGA
jgi:hypothetical protein